MGIAHIHSGKPQNIIPVSITTQGNAMHLPVSSVSDGNVYRAAGEIAGHQEIQIAQNSLNIVTANAMTTHSVTPNLWEGMTIPVHPSEHTGESAKRVEVQTRLSTEINQGNTFLVSVMENVSQLIKSARIANFINDGLRRVFDGLGQSVDQTPLSTVDKQKFEQVIAGQLKGVANSLPFYATPNEEKARGLLNQYAAVKSNREWQIFSVEKKIKLVEQEIASLSREKEEAEQKMNWITDQKEKTTEVSTREEAVENLTIRIRQQKSEISAMILQIGEAQKQIDQARVDNDTNGVRTGKWEIKNLTKEILTIDKDLLSVLQTNLRVLVEPEKVLYETAIKRSELESKLVAARAIKALEQTKLEALQLPEDLRKEEEQMAQIHKQLITLLDQNVGGVFAFLENLQVELALKKDYPSYPLLSTYDQMTLEELNDRDAGERYADYLALARLELTARSVA